jgi:predicted RNase H-like HicB family nuclease
MTPMHHDSYTQARAHLKDMLDAADKGIPVTMRRDATRAAVVDATRLRDLLAETSPARAQVLAEAGGWSVFIPGLPVSADGPTFDEAITEMVDALRGYVSDWQQRLLDVPNHQDSWGVVQLVSLSDDTELRDWLVGAPS